MDLPTMVINHVSFILGAHPPSSFDPWPLEGRHDSYEERELGIGQKDEDEENTSTIQEES